MTTGPFDDPAKADEEHRLDSDPQRARPDRAAPAPVATPNRQKNSTIRITSPWRRGIMIRKNFENDLQQIKDEIILLGSWSNTL
jgi:hypothetical protein